MGNKFEIRKRVTVIIWVFITGLVFWLASFLPNTFDSGSYLRYVFIMFGGGFAFHFFTKLLSAPVNKGNWSYWGELSAQLSAATFTVLAVFGVVYFEKHVFYLHGLLSLIAIIVAMWRVIGYANVANLILNEIEELG